MRHHYWQFLVNQEGQPIPYANIKVYLAGSDTIANVYLNEVTSDILNTVPQISTNKAGFFEFWIGDEEEEYGYAKGQKIKIIWEKSGISFGSIDWIDIFPEIEGVDETSTSEYKNKLISNYLTKKFNDHVDETVAENPGEVHGLEHCNILDTNTDVNKLVSNKILNDLYNRVQNFTIQNLNWIDNGNSTYYVTLNHNIGKEFVSVTCWNTTSKLLYTPLSIYSVDENNTKITVNDNSLNISVVIVGGI